MISDYFEILILALVQGISEFIPVSSSAHLFFISEIYKFNTQSLLIDISLHLGSLLGVLFYFRKELKGIFEDKTLITIIVLGSLPLLIVGLIVYKTGLIYYLRDIKIIAWSTLIFAIILFVVDKFEIKKKLETDMNLKSILIFGLFQILAIVPGVSRSGIVITAGRFMNFNRVDSTKISFYLSIPAIAGASLLGLKDTLNENIDFNILSVFSTILSFIFSYITIKYFLIFVRKFNFNFFVLYRILLSIILFLIIYN